MIATLQELAMRLHHLELSGDILFHNLVRFLERFLRAQGIAVEVET